MGSLIIMVCCSMVIRHLLHAREQVNRPALSKETFQRKEIATMRQTLPSGLAYEIITQAPDNASHPTKGQQVTVHYTGWLSDNGKPGKKFDSSIDRAARFVFTIGVGQVIKGWDEGVMGMKVGEKRRLYIPASLGYGARGAGSLIPPNADLIFDVELYKISA